MNERRAEMDGRLTLAEKRAEETKQDGCLTTETNPMAKRFRARSFNVAAKEELMSEMRRQYQSLAEGLRKFRSLLDPGAETAGTGGEARTVVEAPALTDGKHEARIVELEKVIKTTKEDIRQIELKNAAALREIQKKFNEELHISLRLEGIEPIRQQKPSSSGGVQNAVVAVAPTKKVSHREAPRMLDSVAVADGHLQDQIQGVQDMVREVYRDLGDCATKATVEKLEQTVGILKSEVNSRLKETEDRVEQTLSRNVTAIDALLTESRLSASQSAKQLSDDFSHKFAQLHDSFSGFIAEHSSKLTQCLTEVANLEISVKQRLELAMRNSREACSELVSVETAMIKTELAALGERVNELEKKFADTQLLKTLDLVSPEDALGGATEDKGESKEEAVLRQSKTVSLGSGRGPDRAAIARYEMMINELNLRVAGLESGAQRLEPGNVRALISGIAELLLRDEKKEVEAAVDNMKGRQREYAEIVDSLRLELQKMDERFKQDIKKRVERKDLCEAKNHFRRKVRDSYKIVE